MRKRLQKNAVALALALLRSCYARRSGGPLFFAFAHCIFRIRWVSVLGVSQRSDWEGGRSTMFSQLLTSLARARVFLAFAFRVGKHSTFYASAEFGREHIFCDPLRAPFCFPSRFFVAFCLQGTRSNRGIFVERGVRFTPLFMVFSGGVKSP